MVYQCHALVAKLITIYKALSYRHGKAAERAVLTELTVLKLKSPSSTFTVK